MVVRFVCTLALCLATGTLAPARGWADAAVLDDFETLAGWTAKASAGADVEIARDQGDEGMALRVDFDFHGRSGFLVVRKELAMAMPADFALGFQIRGSAPANDLEVKLVDPSAQNVWRARVGEFEFPSQWKKLAFKRRHFDFAWGPAGGGAVNEIGALELAISSGTGGKGSIWVDRLTFAARDASAGDLSTPIALASTTVGENGPERALDGDAATQWRSGALPEDQWYVLDLQKPREYGGLTIDWDNEDYAAAYDVQVSRDGNEWETAFTVGSGNGGRNYVYLPDGESRYLRLDLKKSSRGEGYGINNITVKPHQFSATPNQFFEAIARDAPIGHYPRYLIGQQSYWTVVGVAGDAREALINEDGMLEVQKRGFSIEPFVYADGDLVTWNDVERKQALEDGYLPIPSVIWTHALFDLETTALAAGSPGRSSLFVRYRLRNRSQQERPFSLYLALRPFQVSPPWQSLNFVAGTSQIRRIRFADDIVSVGNDKHVVSLSTVDRFGAAPFVQGSVTEYLRHGSLPIETSVDDDFGYASAALEYRVLLSPGGVRDIFLQVPFHAMEAGTRAGLTDEEAHRVWDEAHLETTGWWQATLNRVSIELPSAARPLADTLRSNLAYILINADGAALQPGSRAYERSWIRDGSQSASALLRLGHPETVRNFIRWYSSYQFESGRIPCCVDWRGADSVPENDSNGQWIHTLAEYYRYSRDVGLVSELWPQLVKAVSYIDSMSQERMSEEYRTPEKIALYGLVPDSISHEGYSANPAHSYWDNFFSLLGLKDAVVLANAVGEADAAAGIAKVRDRFRDTLYQSIRRSIAQHGIDFIPGAADLGDFDFTATAAAVDPIGELEFLPQPAFGRTLERYLDYFDRRKANVGLAGDNYTPYEIRIVTSLTRMGLDGRARELLDYFMLGQRPKAWRQWAEIVWMRRDAPRFVGDMPHSWIGAEYIKAFLNMLAFERHDDAALVIGAGVPSEWLTNGEGITVRRLPTTSGTLHYTMRLDDMGDLTVDLSGDIRMPPGKVIVLSPFRRPPFAVTVNGRTIHTVYGNSATIEVFPAKVVFRYEP